MYVSKNHPDRERLLAKPEPVAPRGTKLVAIPRGTHEELRVSLDEYEGHPFVSLRVWARATDGPWLPVAGKGCSVRLRELAEVADALREAINVAGVPNAKGVRHPAVNPMNLPPVPAGAGSPPWRGEGEDIPY